MSRLLEVEALSFKLQLEDAVSLSTYFKIFGLFYSDSVVIIFPPITRVFRTPA